MNYSLFQMINDMANQSVLLDAVMITISKSFPYLYVAIVAYLYFCGIKQRSRIFRAQTVAVGVFVVLCAFVSMIVGALYYEERPFVTHEVNLIMAHAADASFPSDHAVGAMAISLGVWWFRRLLGVALMLGSFLVGFSRVFVGNHYPGDVLGGFLLVFLVGYVYRTYIREHVIAFYRGLERKIFD